MKRRLYTPEEDEFIRSHYLFFTLEQIGNLMGRSMRSVWCRMRILNIQLPEEIRIERRNKGLQNGWKNGISTRFKKGNTPWCKGTKGVCKANGNSFQKGHKPHNTKQDRDISLRRMDGKANRKYYWIRISEKNWELLHRFLWKKYYGEIPEGFNVQFKDNNSLNCVIENLELVSKPQNMDNNNINRYPEEIKISIRTLAKLNKTIHSHE